MESGETPLKKVLGRGEWRPAHDSFDLEAAMNNQLWIACLLGAAAGLVVGQLVFNSPFLGILIGISLGAFVGAAVGPRSG